MTDWTTLGELREGAVFETRIGTLALKTEYRTFNAGTQCDCYLLSSGEAAHFPSQDKELVREVEVERLFLVNKRLLEACFSVLSAIEDHLDYGDDDLLSLAERIINDRPEELLRAAVAEAQKTPSNRPPDAQSLRWYSLCRWISTEIGAKAMTKEAIQERIKELLGCEKTCNCYFAATTGH